MASADGLDSVKVAVRVRPFNQREIDRNSKCIITMSGQMTSIKDPNSNDENSARNFMFDHSYWSHDGFKENANGLFEGIDDKYASQQNVFNDLGDGVLQNAWEGYNTALFAYGQTGSGKSFSMVGYGVNKGIVPITCDELFLRIAKNQETSLSFQVTFSMFEIYNEAVRDLLNKKVVRGGLPVRQHPEKGFYVEGLRSVAVSTYEEIESRNDEGTQNRTVAATQMNSTLSRAHTVVIVSFKQIRTAETGKTIKNSNIYLVDLAGSERADSTGATGDRLREGANINKSLSTLGNVISALADISGGKKGIIVPYRNSTLTKLLQNALGGNSKTIMIAALSPAGINYEETLSTLRYADRAKQIKNRAVVNESAADKLIRELKEENQRLAQLMKEIAESANPSIGLANKDGVDEKTRRDAVATAKAELEAQLQANEKEMANERLGWEEQLRLAREQFNKEKEEIDIQRSAQRNRPHLVNLNEDPQLSGVLVHMLRDDVTVVGRKEASPEPDIIITGLSIRMRHATFLMVPAHGEEENTIQEVSIMPVVTGARIKVNGETVMDRQQLTHNDRILFGSNHMYVFVHPVQRDHLIATGCDFLPVTWDHAQEEIARVKGFNTELGEGKSEQQQQLQDIVLHLLPLVGEANAISEELNRHKSFEIVIVTAEEFDARTQSLRPCDSAMVKVTDLLNGTHWLWSLGKFQNRRYLMNDYFNEYLESGRIETNLNLENDPFYDSPEDLLVGTASVYLESLAYGLDIDDNIQLLNYQGEIKGDISVIIALCGLENEEPLGPSHYLDDPKKLLGRPLIISIFIQGAVLDTSRLFPSYRCAFRFFRETRDNVTEHAPGGVSATPQFNFHKVIRFDSVTKELLEYLQTGYLSIRIYSVSSEDGCSDVGINARTALASHVNNLDETSETTELRKCRERIAKLESRREHHVSVERKCKKVIRQLRRIGNKIQESSLMTAVEKLEHIFDTTEDEQIFNSEFCASAATSKRIAATKLGVSSLAIELETKDSMSDIDDYIKSDDDSDDDNYADDNENDHDSGNDKDGCFKSELPTKSSKFCVVC